MADRDVRVDQSPDDAASAPGGTAAGSGDAGNGQGAEVSDKDDLLDGETDVVEPETTADGPPPMEAESGTGLEGLQTGAGGSGGGGLWDQVGDAYDAAEDAFHDAADDAGDAAGGAYDKMEGGAASLGHDIEHEVAQNWRDAGTWDRDAFGEHRGGLADPWGTANAPFQAADRAYDAVEDDIAKGYDDSGLKDAYSGVKDAYDATEDVVSDRYDGSTLKDAYDATEDVVSGDAVRPGVHDVNHALWGNRNAEDIYENVEASVDKANDDTEGAVDKAYDDTTEAVGDAYGQGAGVSEDAGHSVGGTVDGGFGSGDGGGGSPPGLDDFGRDGGGESEPSDPPSPIDGLTWDATRQVAEQAGAEDAQDAASELDGLLDDPGPISVPGPAEADGFDLD